MLFPKLLINNNSHLILFFHELSTTSYKSQTLYEILKLSKDCSSSDIRNAYLKLSKQYHPDRNTDQNSHKKFVKISEAYNILSKPLARSNYDRGLSDSTYTSSVHSRTAPQGTWSDDTFWQYRDKTQDNYYKSQPYYGIKGIKKLSNLWIVFICLGFTTIGVLLQIIAVRRSFTLRRSDLEKRSAELEKLHAEVRARALANGDKKQIELLVERLNKDKN